MDAKLYLNKAIMQLSRGLEEGGVQSLKDALKRPLAIALFTHASLFGAL